MQGKLSCEGHPQVSGIGYICVFATTVMWLACVAIQHADACQNDTVQEVLRLLHAPSTLFAYINTWVVGHTCILRFLSANANRR